MSLLRSVDLTVRNASALALVASLGLVAVVMGQQAAVPQPVSLDLPAPRLVGSTNDWLNTKGRRLEFEKGRVYVVDFWTFGCVNCQRNLPAYERWQKRFAMEKLTIIGIHTPETAAEKQTTNVLRQVSKLGITYPVLVDQTGVNWKAWQQEVWPTIYLVDKRGHVRSRWAGELNWQGAGGEAKMLQQIQQLLKEP